MSTYQESATPFMDIRRKESPPPAPLCVQGHEWQATLFIGYYQCARCDKLAACQACVSKVRGKALVGYCRAHQHLGASATEQQEVLG